MSPDDRSESQAVEETNRPRRGPGVIRWIIFLAGVLAVTAVALVAVLYGLFAAGDPALSRHIVGAVNEAIGTDSTRFACARVRATALHGAVLDRPRLLIRGEQGEGVWAEARRIRIGFDLVRLLLDREKAFDIAVDSPRVTLRHDSSGRLILPRFAARARSREPGPPFRARIRWRAGWIASDFESLRFEAFAGRAEVARDRRTTKVLLENVAARSAAPGRPGRIRIGGMIVASGDSVRADPLRVSLDQSRVLASLEWDLLRGRIAEGVLRFEPLDLDEIFGYLDWPRPDAVLRGEARFTGIPSDGEATGCLAGTFAGESIDTLLFTAAFRRGMIEAQSLRVRVRGAELTGTAAFALKGQVDADLRVRGADPAILPWLRAPGNTPHGTIAGRVRLRAERRRPRTQVSARVDLDQGRVGRFAWRSGYFMGRLEPNGAAAIDSGALVVAGATLRAKGTLSADRRMAISFAGSIQDLGAMGALLAPVKPDSGRGRLVGELAGPLERPRFSARVEITRGRVHQRIQFDSLAVRTEGTFPSLSDAQTRVRLTGFRASGRPLGDVEAQLAGAARLTIDRYRQALGDTVLTARGSVGFTDRVITATLDSISLAIEDARIGNRAPLTFVIRDGTLHASSLALDLNPGSLDADVEWDFETSRIDARGAFRGIGIARLAPAGRGGTSRGELSADFLLSGPVADPDASLRAHVIDPYFGGVEGDSLSVALDYAPGSLVVEHARWVAGSSRASVSGALRSALPLERWLGALRDGSPDRAADVAIDLVAKLDSFDLVRLAPIDTTLQTLRGVASLRTRATGTLASPRLTIQGNVAEALYRGIAVDAADFAMTYGAERLTLDTVRIAQGSTVSTLTGSVPLDLRWGARDRVPDNGIVALSVGAPDIDFSIASLLLPDLAASAGHFRVEAEITGTASHPHVTGSCRLTDGRVRFAGRYEVFDRMAGEATFDEERLTITKLVGRQGRRGRATATGYWAWPTEAPPPGVPKGTGPGGAYEIQVRAEDVRGTDRETYDIVFSGDFSIVSATLPSGASAPLITGFATVSSGKITLDLAQPPGGPPPPRSFLYEIAVDMPRNFTYRSLDTEVGLEGRLQLKNEGEGDLALGTLRVTSGQLYFLTRKFSDLTGEIRFDSPDRVDPSVEIDSKALIPVGEDVREVHLAVTGHTSALKIRPWDSHGSSANDLWKLLSFGQFSHIGEEEVAGVEALDTPSTNGAGVSLPITAYLFRNAERVLTATGFVDTIDLRGESGRTGATEGDRRGLVGLGGVGLGKFVTPELYLKYSQSFTGEQEQAISAEYRVTRFLLLRGQQIRRLEAAQPSASQEYNLDLKIRLEY